MFPRQTYLDRRKTLLSHIEQGLILLLGNEMSSINYPDQHYPFRQDSSFLYYLGIDRPGLAALLDPGTGKTTLFGDEYSLDMLVWVGKQTELRQLAEQSGIESIRPAQELAQAISHAQGKGQDIHFLPPYRPENLIKLHKLLGLGLAEVETGYSTSLIAAVVKQRSYKTEEEILQMEEAVNLSAAMHLSAMRSTKVGLKESAIMSVAQQAALEADSRPAYGVICTVHGEVLHNEVYHHALTEDRLLLLDAGAESPLHYAGDITRTWPVRGRFSQQQKEIYEIVESALRDSAQKLAPGMSYWDVHLGAAQILFSGLKELGLVKGDVEEAVQAGAHTLFFPHGLGHMIGLDVHDMEDLGEDRVGYDETYQRDPRFGFRSLRLGRELETGFALTVEPGIYFIPALIDAWQAEGKYADFINYKALTPYRNFGGIRLENDYYITGQGARLIGDPIPLSVAEVEAVMG